MPVSFHLYSRNAETQHNIDFATKTRRIQSPAYPLHDFFYQNVCQAKVYFCVQEMRKYLSSRYVLEPAVK